MISRYRRNKVLRAIIRYRHECPRDRLHVLSPVLTGACKGETLATLTTLEAMGLVLLHTTSDGTYVSLTPGGLCYFERRHDEWMLELMRSLYFPMAVAFLTTLLTCAIASLIATP